MGQVDGGAVELVPERLYALGGMVPLDGRVSWVPPDAKGYQPLNCYLLLEGDRALLVDTGAPLHQEQVLSQIRGVVGDARLSVFISRFEMDCAGNVGPLSTILDLDALYTGGYYNPFDGFDDIRTIGGDDRYEREISKLVRVKPDDVFTIGADRLLKCLLPPFRMLTSYWAYDTGTGTLFTSDLFGQHVLDTSEFTPAIDRADDRSTFDSVKAFTESRYWWLDRVEKPALLASLDAIFDEHDVQRIAPNHGCVVSGKEHVTMHYDLMRQLLTDDDEHAAARARAEGAIP